MHPNDTFFKRLQPLEDFARLYEKSERFGNWNPKTLGVVLVRCSIAGSPKTLLYDTFGPADPLLFHFLSFSNYLYKLAY